MSRTGDVPVPDAKVTTYERDDNETQERGERERESGYVSSRTTVDKVTRAVTARCNGFPTHENLALITVSERTWGMLRQAANNGFQFKTRHLTLAAQLPSRQLQIVSPFPQK
ncbi:uncharacterized protein SPSK_08150 [Sporothrix schenckii 1099-18]|uniref:Uncharacterized protein n=1 Tax=Sporothrix schenckii 1099-18 TaxID=1397361 RepID=A0A0F2MEH3_SPOSC|nr:uncharacterized protein SPSK_08150 [Sporothrix schenckii 1099-18]KJR88083.1 hypothetical protein SPSK_08150 [Sporothrix schenckii 1099-18]